MVSTAAGRSTANWTSLDLWELQNPYCRVLRGEDFTC